MVGRIVKGLLALSLLLAAAPAWAQQAVGDWHGRLVVGAISPRIGVRVTQAPDGSLSGTMTSPDQGPAIIPLSEVSIVGAKFSFAAH
jgi:hypothetical protein